ncbi:MAG: hypothetical protein WC508_01650 [Patescibacteria group bacterium]
MFFKKRLENLDNPFVKKKEPFKIENLPEETRKSIFLVSIIILMLAVISIWLFSLKDVLNIVQQPASDANWNSLAKDLADFSNNTKLILDKTKQGLNQLAPTSTTELTADQVTTIKDKLLANETADWQIYSNTKNNFIIKYPAELTIAQPTDNDSKNLIVSFKNTETDKTVKIKKYDLLSDFSQLSGVKNYWQKDDYFLVIFDFINNTSTNLMVQTFKFNK